MTSWLVAVVAMLIWPADKVEPYRIVPHWKIADFAGHEAMEAELLRMVNYERARAGVQQLTVNEQLLTAARQHSHEMIEEDYFAHESPHDEWRSPQQRAYRAGFWDDATGENIVYYSTTGRLDLEALPRELMYGRNGWMNSPGHRANLLRPDYTETGMGAVVQNGTVYATQLFGERYWDIQEAFVEDRGRTWRLWGKAKLLREAQGVYPALDNQYEDRVEVGVGEVYDFSVDIPADRRRHVWGLFPGSAPDAFWVRNIFFVDTSKPFAEAFALPGPKPARPRTIDAPG